MFFDGTEAVDLALLHSSVRDHTEIAAVALEVTTDIVDYFTEAGQPTLRERNVVTGTTLFWYMENNVVYTVHLWGYHEDPEKASGFNADRDEWTGFCKAFRECIADVVSHRLRHYDEDHGIQAETHGRESWTYRTSREPKWPNNWKKRLRKYITKAPVYSV